MTFPFLYAESLDFTKFVRSVLNVAIAFAFCTLVHALIAYIAMIKSKISALMLENLGLLDGMHEGIIVISGEDESLQFAN